MKFSSLLALVAACLVGCSDDSSSSANSVAPAADTLHAGLVHLKSSGKSAQLGSNDELALGTERPQMAVKFDYDFSIGEHEVTCGEFAALMKYRGNCEKDSLPQTSVSYYDAVLYANARSKAEGLDTAYRYSLAKFDSAGSCILLESLLFDADKEAYRLPTEAEWVFAAQAGFDRENSWNASNSDFELHAVCSRSKNENGLCDMAGNAMEWVNDWLGYFRDTTVTNFAGATDGGALSERVVKGGSYKSEVAKINLFSRGDVYTVSSGKKAPYIGFRLAFGAIPDALWLDFNGMAKTSRLQTVFSGTEVKKKLGTHWVKLAFRNNETQNIAFVNYASWGSSVFEIVDTINAYHPEISPDGRWVAFCTMPEGSSGKSSLYVRKLELGFPAIKLEVESAAIPRWIVSKGDTLISYVDDAGNNRDESVWKEGDTWVVPFKDGGFGSPRKILEGRFHGGTTANGSFAVTGSQRLRVHRQNGSSSLDTVWYNGEQACNVSLSKDDSKRVLFLDFASKTGMDFVGATYDIHERILFADSLGNLTSSIGAPEKYSFDHTEWVNSDYVIATLTDPVYGTHPEVAMVNVKDSSVTSLVRGGDLWHPSLWVDKIFALDSSESSLDPDSAGYYYMSGYSMEALINRQKLELFWNNVDSVNTVILGSSRPSAGADPLAFGEDVFALNMTIIPHILYESRYMLENYIVPHARNLKYIVVSLDIDLWYMSERENVYNFFAMEAPYIPGYVYDKNHNFWKDESYKGMDQYTLNSFNEESARKEYTYHRGMQVVPPYIGWEEEPAVDYDSTWLDSRREDYEINRDNLVSIIKLAAEKDVKVVGVIFPQSPNYKKTGSFGRYGIRRSEADSLIKDLANLSKTYRNFKLLDENKMGNHDYPDSLAFNRDHLINEAGKMISPRIDSVLHSF